MIACLMPLISLGDIHLGDRISNYLDKYDFKFKLNQAVGDEKYDEYFLKDGNITIYVQDGVVESINCYEECLYKGRNLIGMTIEEFISHTGFEHEEFINELDFEEDNIPQYVYDFDKEGLQVWVKNEKIVTIIVSEYIPDDE